MNDKSTLKQISPDKIDRNPENPRLFFRTEEMETLMASIRQYGIQVPITVYEDSGKYILIDGERRWRCSLKLNLARVPAIIQPKPSKLDNLLLMFNIHALREQWDYLTIANKLPSVVKLFQEKNGGNEPTEIELSALTGLARGQIRRCRLLLNLPPRYRRILEEELAKPKNVQSLSEDFFIEMERALKTVQARVPGAIANVNDARDALIVKTRTKVNKNITDFRKLSKIATSVDNLEVPITTARSAIRKIVAQDNKISISDVYSKQFEVGYDQRKIALNINSIQNFINSIPEDEEEDLLSDEIIDDLRALHKSLGGLLKRLR